MATNRKYRKGHGPVPGKVLRSGKCCAKQGRKFQQAHTPRVQAPVKPIDKNRPIWPLGDTAVSEDRQMALQHYLSDWRHPQFKVSLSRKPVLQQRKCH